LGWGDRAGCRNPLSTDPSLNDAHQSSGSNGQQEGNGN